MPRNHLVFGGIFKWTSKDIIRLLMYNGHSVIMGLTIAADGSSHIVMHFNGHDLFFRQKGTSDTEKSAKRLTF